MYLLLVPLNRYLVHLVIKFVMKINSMSIQVTGSRVFIGAVVGECVGTTLLYTMNLHTDL